MGQLRMRGPAGAQFEFTLAAIAQNLPRLAKLTVHPPDTGALRVALVASCVGALASPTAHSGLAAKGFDSKFLKISTH